MKNESNSTEQPAAVPVADDGIASRSVRTRLSRRSVVAGALTGAAGLGLAFAEAGTRGGRSASAAQEASATPEGSPAASPVPTNTPTPTPSPTPVPLLTIVTDQQPTYSGPPLETTRLNLFVASAGLTTFSPPSMAQDPQIAASYLDSLVWADNNTMEPEPALATSWSWNKDGTELTIKLRQGVKWHDGTAFTAQDVSFSLNVYRLDYDSAVARFFANVDHFAINDPNSIKVVFSAPDGAFVFNALTLPIFQRAQYTKFWAKNP
ncbi:MAG TPA: ABC transporter substrate-binding protein, partial [Thermomicrobiales bacterium]|nr:ABC transporter substrate-binding protein [Thermomicrobiales bacterium]